MVNTSVAQEAPAPLEDVRMLLNSWLIPNDTREPDDQFDAYAKQHRIPVDQRDALRELRDSLRAVVEQSTDDDGPADEVFNGWVERLGIRPSVTAGTIGFQHNAGRAGEILVTALTAISAGQWPRLKACPDCRWVFYDHTRNGSKRWCLMTAGGPDGRSCGSIAKVRAYRQRTRSGTTRS